MVPNRILVATDGSPSARSAEMFAASLADKLGESELVLAKVVPPRDMPLVKGAALYPSTPDEVAAADEALSEAVARVKAAVTNPAVKVDSVLIEAYSAANGIIEEAHSKGTCSLIVMGSRGHGGFASLVLGSVSTQVLHHAHCPVLIVRAED